MEFGSKSAQIEKFFSVGQLPELALEPSEVVVGGLLIQHLPE
jgi:hypothetical protein